MIKVFEMTAEKRSELIVSCGYRIDHLAYTLEPEYIDKAKDFGWVFHTEVVEDFYEWINEFCAVRLTDHAAVWGDFEKVVYASTKDAADEFMRLFPPQVWDYLDI